MMTKTQKNSINDKDIDEDELLALSHFSGTELDYEWSDSLLDSDDGKSNIKPVKQIGCEKVSLPTKLPKEILAEKQTTIVTGSKAHSPQQTQAKCDFNITADDFKPTTYDVLDLQRMADKFAEMRKAKCIEKIVYEEVGGFNYTVVTRTDRMLEEAHNILYKQHSKLDRETRTHLQNSILKMMMELPHLYVPMPPEKQRSSRVKDWLNKHTSHPEPEMCGFSMPDSIQPRKFVTDIQPRISTSETNVVLGKRKRGCGLLEDGDAYGINKSSSDTRIEMHADWARPCLSSKRRRVEK